MMMQQVFFFWGERPFILGESDLLFYALLLLQGDQGRSGGISSEWMDGETNRHHLYILFYHESIFD